MIKNKYGCRIHGTYTIAAELKAYWLLVFILFGKINFMSGRFCNLCWPKSLGFSLHQLNQFSPLLMQRFSYY